MKIIPAFLLFFAQFICGGLFAQSIYKNWYLDSIGCVNIRKDTFSDVGIEELVIVKTRKNTITFIKKYGKTFLSPRLKMKFTILKLTEDTLIISQKGYKNNHRFEELFWKKIIFISNEKSCGILRKECQIEQIV